MKLRPESLAPLLIFTVILLTGCSGCAQKNAPQSSIDTTSKVVQTPTDSVEDIAPKKMEQKPVSTPQQKKTQKPKPAPYQNRMELDAVLNANPNDYDMMLMWVKLSGSMRREGESYETYKRKRIDVLRKLYETNPDHPNPDVLYGLVEMLYDVYPQQAIEYVQKFIKLYPKHKLRHLMDLWLAASYFKACEYETALTQYKKAYNIASEEQVRPQDFLRNPRITQIDYISITTLIKLLEGTDAYRDEFKKNMDTIQTDRRKRLGLE